MGPKMKVSLGASPSEANPYASALGGWYASHPMVRYLWAFRKSTGDEQSDIHRIRVIFVIDPTLDGDETSPVWIANAHKWARELRACMGSEVELELLETPLQDEVELDGEGDLVAALSWREPCTSAN